MIEVEHSETFDASAADVFAVLIDIEARATWQPAIIEVHITPTGPAKLGASILEVGKFSGYKSEKTLTVSEFEQDRRLALATPADAPAPFHENYWIEPISEATCRLHCTIEIGGLPKVGEFFVRQAVIKEMPKNFARLKSLLATHATQGERS